MKVLLVANYRADGQESMLRFADALCTGLRAAGAQVTVARPEAFFGKWRPAPSGFGKWLGYLDKFLLFPRRLRQLAESVDVVHLCDHSNAMYVRHIAGRPHLVTCNDLLAIRAARGEFPGRRTRLTGRILQRWILSGLRRARRLTCISEATRRDALRLTGQAPEAVSVTYMGQNFPYAPMPEIQEAAKARRNGKPYDPEIFARHGLPRDAYLLHVGGMQWYKNRPGVYAIHEALRSRLGGRAPRLVVVGPPSGAERPDVETRQGVGNEALRALYAGAELLLFPSLEEGFGWPIIEAQACGCRVVTTGKPPMTEVGGNAIVALADPTNAEEGAARVEELLEEDAAAGGRLIEAGMANAALFSTERMIREYLAIYEELRTR